MDEKARTRQFWLRFLLVIGLLGGLMPFITVPFITRGANDTTFDIYASVINSLSVLPACALAFWHRRIACIWLSIDGVMIAIALITFIQHTGQVNAAVIAGVALPMVMALILAYAEFQRWPKAVETRKARVPSR